MTKTPEELHALLIEFLGGAQKLREQQMATLPTASAEMHQALTEAIETAWWLSAHWNMEVVQRQSAPEPELVREQ